MQTATRPLRKGQPVRFAIPDSCYNQAVAPFVPQTGTGIVYKPLDEDGWVEVLIDDTDECYIFRQGELESR